MGARRVLQVAAVGVAAWVAIAGAPATARAQAAADGGDGEPVIVVDLRPGDGAARQRLRAALIGELRGVQGLSIAQAPGEAGGLDGALAGEAADRDVPALTAALDEARAAFGALDCARTTAAADRAVDLLAARQASGLDDGAALRSAWALLLLCADQAGDRARAQTAADRLRGLGVTDAADAGLSDATWSRFPEIDAQTDRDVVAVTIEAEPGAAVWVDHAPVGAAPLTVYVAAGEHLVAAGAGSRRAAARVRADRKAVTAKLDLVDQAGTHSAIAGVVAAWRDGAAAASAEQLGAVMDTVDVRFALVLAGTDTIQVWAKGPGDRVARKLDDGVDDDVMGIAAMITDRVVAWDGRAPDPDVPLLYETERERAGRRADPVRWWVYASIVGAVLVGSGILYLQDTADDHQTITISF